MIKFLRTSLWLVAGSLLALAASAQPLGDTLYTVGTTITNSLNGQAYAVVIWQPVPNLLIPGKKFAVYSKPGDASASAPFVRRSITGLTTDPLVIDPLLTRASGLGEDLFVLNDHVANLFAALMPSNNVSLAQRLAVVIAGALGDSRNQDSLAALGRVHLGLNFCLGRAYAEGITGVTTFEVREYDLAAAKDVMVVGRVTLDPAGPTALPAPGAPVALPETGSFGHLNAKLRWSTPDNLRRLSLLQYGYNVYTAPRAVVESAGYQSVPPTLAQLLKLPNVRKVNRSDEGGSLPVMAARLYAAADVANFALDPKTHFLADDNYGTRGGAGYHDGDQVYYFVTACDVLGRDGIPSPGTLVTLCSKIPPNPPTGVRVDNDFPNTPGTSQHLKVRWRIPATSTNSAWFVYRWNDSKQIAALGNNPTNHLIAGPLSPSLASSSPELAWLDDGSGSPSIATDTGKTFWYTVREAENTACGWNYSPHSAPTFGVLRDRVGPDAPQGGVNFRCCQPSLTSDYTDYVLVTNAQTVHVSGDEFVFQLVGHRAAREFEWMDFVLNLDSPISIGRFYFSGTNDTVTAYWRVPVTTVVLWQQTHLYLTFTARAGGSRLTGDATAYFNHAVDRLGVGQNSGFGLSFTASLNCDTASVLGYVPQCLTVQSFGSSLQQLQPGSNAPVNFGIYGFDYSRTVEWVEVFVNGTAAANLVAHVLPGQFGSFTALIATNDTIYTDPVAAPVFYLRAGKGSLVSDFKMVNGVQRPPFGYVSQISFSAGTNCLVDTGPGGGGGGGGRLFGCDHHTPVLAGVPGISPLIPWFSLTPTAQEWRVYRRVDDGPLQLIKQGLPSLASAQGVTNSDQALPANAATVCYYAQLLDEQGNPSAMSPLGCVNVGSTAPPAAPLLAPLEAAGTPLAPQMKISWFCPPAGVDRFELCIAAEGQDPAFSLGGAVTADNFSLFNPQTVPGKENPITQNFGYYRTPKASVLGGGSALFTRTVDIKGDTKYFVFVRSVLGGSDFSPFSNVGEFIYHPPPVIPPPGVAWPQRPLPGYLTNLYPTVAAYPLIGLSLNPYNYFVVTNVGDQTFGYEVTFPVNGVRWLPGVRIGDLAKPVNGAEGLRVTVAEIAAHLETGLDYDWSVYYYAQLGVSNPLQSITKDSKGKSVLPAVLYRTQIPNLLFPRVSGDLIQVTPQMGGVAHQGVPGHPENCFVGDPFIYPYELNATASLNGVTNEFHFSGLFLLDTQPRLIAATYFYLLVRFNEVGEVRDVLPCGEYTEPLQP